MRTVLSMVVVVGLAGPAWAGEVPSIPEVPVVASPAADPLQARLVAHNRIRKRDQTISMSVLLGWSIANMGTGAVGWALTRDPEWQAFHQMNLAWNAVNFALAVPGLLSGLRDDPTVYDLGDTLKNSGQMRTSFAVNAGLDVGWVMAGAWLWERGLRTDDPRLAGYGRSMVLQGGFLLVFDLAMWLVRGAKDRQLMLTPVVDGALGVGLAGRF